jgi:single-strand DNA-binding protein
LLNKIFLQGRLVADPELRHTQSGIPMASFRIAVDRDFKDRNTGERKADFINVVAWRQTAEFVSRFLSKGRLVIVEGKLQTRDYNDKDGNRRYATEVVADNVYFGDSKRDSEGGYAPPPPSTSNYGNSYQAAPGSYAPNAGSYPAAPAVDQFADLTDDDGELPF